MTPIKLSEEIITLLNERLGDEYQAHYLYTNAANWCNDQAYFNAAKFFEKEASSELDHAKKLEDFMVSWNIKPVIPQVTTKFYFSSLPGIIEKAYQIEYDLYQKYNETSKKIFVKDITTFDFLGWFREIQRTSVAEYSVFLNALELIDKENKFQVLYFEQTYFGE